MRRIALAILLFATVITAASARQKNRAAASFDSVREFIKRQLTERRLPSISVAVARDGQIIWEEAFGWADSEKRVPATPHTMYSLASISKPITATGLMILKERGRVELDRPINEYLGEAKVAVRVGNPAEATVDMGPNTGYGIGWVTTESPGVPRRVEHGGGMGGASTLLRLYPAEKIAIVVLGNASSNLPGQVMEQIVAVVAPETARNPGAQNQAPPGQDFKPSGELLGAWQGKVHTYKGELTFKLLFQPDGDVHAQLGSQLKTLLSRPQFKGGYLSGSFAGDIGTEDANRTRYLLMLSLKLRGDVLNGAMTAQSVALGRRVGNALTHWVELKKE